MSEPVELKISELRRKQEESNENSFPHAEDAAPDRGKEDEEIWPRQRRSSTQLSRERFQPDADSSSSEEESLKLPFDPTRLFEALRRKWYWWMGAGLILCAAGIYYTLWITRSTVGLQLMLRESPMLFRATESGEAFKPQQFSGQTLVALVKNPEVLNRTSEKANPPVSASKLALSLSVVPQPETDLVTLILRGDWSPRQTVDLLNLYAAELVRFTQEMQAKEAEGIVAFVGDKLRKVETELAAVDAEMKKLPPEARVSSTDKLTETLLNQLAELEVKHALAQMDLERNNPINDQLQSARAELAALLVRKTEEHPDVQDQRIKIKSLEAELASAGTNTVKFGAASVGRTSDALLAQTQTVEKQAEQLRVLRDQVRAKLEGLSERSLDYAMIKTRFQSLESLRSNLAGRQREAQLFIENSLGYFQVFTPASIERVSTKGHYQKGFLVSIVGGFLAMIGVAALILLVEVFDDRIKTASDVTRVTGLPLLATLGDLEKMDSAAQHAWAFRTWTILKGKLSANQTQGMVCGFIAAHHGEGCTTWVNLLTKTANQRGLRVLTVATKSTDEPPVHPHETTERTSTEKEALAEKNLDAANTTTTLSPTAFAFPAQVSQQLNDPNSHSIVHIPLPGWVWNLERRQQWQVALDHWRKIENLVLLVELPPASEPESILLAEKVPQLIWLTDSGKSKVHETRTHLETLRHAGCNLVGAVLNREPTSFWNRHITRRFGMGALFFLLSFSSLQALEPGAAAEDAATNAIGSFSVTSPKQRANWQKRLTLGPGDILTLGFYGDTNLTKLDVTVRPDGRISYLQAHDINATGLTVEELRDKFNQELSKYYRSPRVLVSPVAYNSKKYYVAGKVLLKGAFTLDRPMTILEAVARAQGLETGILNRNSVDLADLDRSFLVRDGKRVPIDFGKLFEQGDLSQNIPIEPNDYLYFPSATLKEVYVVGEVQRPGVVPYRSDTSILAALTDRGGFTKRAFKSRVLIVRGSLNHPETIVADTPAMVDARHPDFKLRPKDIIYVSSRPFNKAEELLDAAATSFIQSAVTSWAGGFIGPVFNRPFVPRP